MTCGPAVFSGSFTVSNICPPEPKGSLGEETIDLKIKSRGVLSGGRQGKVSLSRLSLTISGNMSVFSPRREQPQAGVQGDLGVDSSAA